jgi:hypothetical protein
MSNYQKQRNSNKFKTAANYGRDRLQQSNLTITEGFDYCPETADVLIQYFDLFNNREYYSSPDERKTLAIECREQDRNRKPYKARRINPERLTGRDSKYIRPAGTHSRTFIPLQTRQLYASDIPCNIEISTEGEIKAAVANKILGKNCAVFGYSGISNYRECKQVKKFSIKKQPANFVLNYDSDAIKQGNKERISQFFTSAYWAIVDRVTLCKLQGLTLPKFYICIQNPEQQHKGLDDILQAHGLQAAAEFKTCQTSQYFIFAEINPNNLYNCLSKFFNYENYKYRELGCPILLRDNYYKDRANKLRIRLSDILQDNGLSPVFIFGKQLEMPTGIGKTTIALKAAAQQKTVFFAPLLALTDQVLIDAKTAGIDAIKYTGNTKDRQLLADRINAGLLPQLIVCTFASARSLTNMLAALAKVYNLIVDEFHTSSTGNFMIKQLNELFDAMPNYRTITTMTGTTLLNLHPATKDLPRVIVRLSGQPKTKTIYLSATDPLQAAAMQFKKAIAEGKKPYLLFNNKKDGLSDLQAIFASLNIENSCILNADTKDKDEWKKLIEQGIIDDETTGIITTSVFELGVNNNTEMPAEIIALGEFHPASIKQFKERQRLAECTLTIVQKRRNEPKRVQYVDSKKDAELSTKKAQELCELLNRIPADNDILNIRASIESTFIRKKDDIYIPNFVAIQCKIIELEKNWFNSSPERLLRELEKYQFEVYSDPERKKLSILNISNERDIQTQLVCKGLREIRKENKKELFESITAELSAEPFPQIAATKKAQAKDITKDSREFYDMFLAIRTECKTDPQALELFKASEGKNSRVKLTIQRLKTKRANFDSHELGNAPAAIIRSFSIGQVYSPEQLKSLFIDCLRTDRTINLQPFERCGMPVIDDETGTERLTRIDAILKRLRMFFEVETYGINNSDYKILPLPAVYN